MKKQLFIGLLTVPFLFTSCSQVKALYVQDNFSVQVGSIYENVVVSTKPQIDGLKIGIKANEDYESYFKLYPNSKPCEKGEYRFTIEGLQSTPDKPIMITFFVGDVIAMTSITVTP